MEQKNRQNKKASQKRLYQDIIDGGLRVPNILTTFKSLKLAWTPRLLKVKTVQTNLGCISQCIILKSMVHLTSYFDVITILISFSLFQAPR